MIGDLYGYDDPKDAATEAFDALRAEVTQLLTKAHGRSFAIANPGADVFADWQARPEVPGQFSALSEIMWVQAPSGSLVITGSEPPPKSVLTVR